MYAEYSVVKTGYSTMGNATLLLKLLARARQDTFHFPLCASTIQRSDGIF